MLLTQAPFGVANPIKNGQENRLERAAGIEPASLAWKAKVLPLHNARIADHGLIHSQSGVKHRTATLRKNTITNSQPATLVPRVGCQWRRRSRSQLPERFRPASMTPGACPKLILQMIRKGKPFIPTQNGPNLPLTSGTRCCSRSPLCRQSLRLQSLAKAQGLLRGTKHQFAAVAPLAAMLR